MKKKDKRTKVKKAMIEKKYNTNVEDFINNVHENLKDHHQNNYPNDIKNLFERLGIE